jgi:hypothetical protein
MATINKRGKRIFGTVINGVTAGGPTMANVQFGYDEVVQSSPDGLAVAIKDYDSQFVRGSQAWQDLSIMIGLLTGAVGSSVFYEAESGAATYTKHQINNPVIREARIGQQKGQYANCSSQFECRFADPTKTIADVFVSTAAQVAPAVAAAARGGWRVATTTFTPDGGAAINLYHLLAFDFMIRMRLSKACNDGDLGYTAVDADQDGMEASGSVSLQDNTVDTAKILAVRLVLAGRGTLVMNLVSSAGAVNKVVTIAGVRFGSGGRSLESEKEFNDGSLPFEVINSATTPLTLAGANKIITIADAGA